MKELEGEERKEKQDKKESKMMKDVNWGSNGKVDGKLD